MQEIVRTSDVLVFATPIYYYEMSGQMKTFLDRLNPLYICLLYTSACTTFTGQNYGAGLLSRCRRVGKICTLQNLAATVASSMIVLAAGPYQMCIRDRYTSPDGRGSCCRDGHGPRMG